MNKRKISWIVAVLLLFTAVFASGQSKSVRNAQKVLDQGNVFLKQADYDKAVEQYDLAVQLYPENDRNFQKFFADVAKMRLEALMGKQEQARTEQLAKEKQEQERQAELKRQEAELKRQEQERLEQAFVSIPVTPESSFKYDLRKEGLVITGYTGTAKELRIPTSIQGVPVWGIEGFTKNTNITRVVIPESIKNMGAGIFQDCSNLTSVLILANISLAERAFQGCSKLSSVVKAGGVSPGASAFKGCTSLKSIDISESGRIGASAFQDCVNLTSVSSYPRSIGAEAFRNCRSLTGEISLMDNEIGNNAFAGTGFTAVTLSLSSDQGSTIEFVNGRLVEIQRQIKSIPDGLFSGCTALTTVNLTGVTGIGVKAFFGCTSLANITIPASVTGIGEQAFKGCTALTSVTIPASTLRDMDDANAIGAEAFSSCTALTTVEIDKLESLGKGAFQNCTSLTTVTIKQIRNSGWSKSDNAFAGCGKLTLASQAHLRRMGYTGSF